MRSKLKELWKSPLLRSVALALSLGLLVHFIGYAIYSSGNRDLGHFVGWALSPFVVVVVVVWVWRRKLKDLWQYAVFRWCVYVTPLLVFGLGLLNANAVELADYRVVILILIFTLPAFWVWRKPIWKLVKQALGFLNKKAEEG